MQLCTGATPLKTHNRRQARFTQLVQAKAKRLQRRWHTLFAHALARLDRRRITPDDLPALAAFRAERRLYRLDAPEMPALAELMVEAWAEREVLNEPWSLELVALSMLMPVPPSSTPPAI